MRSKTSPRTEDDATQAPTARESLDIASLRRACANTLHLACAFLGDRDVRRIIKGLLELSNPLREEHHWQNTTNRSCAGAFDVYQRYALGVGRQSLSKILDTLYSSSFLADIGVHDRGRLPPGLAIPSTGESELEPHAQTPEILDDTILIRQLVMFVEQLLKARLRSLSWSERGYPGCFIKLLASNAEQKELLTKMRQDWAMYNKLLSMRSKAAKALQRRSCMDLMVVQKAVVMGRGTRIPTRGIVVQHVCSRRTQQDPASEGLEKRVSQF